MFITNQPNSRLIYGAAFIAAAGVVATAAYVGTLTLKELASGLFALLGTFLGATLAFRLNEDRENKKEQNRRKIALNRVLFILARQWNAVKLIAKQLEPYKTPFDRAFNFPAAKLPAYTDLAQKFDDLDFLIETSDVNSLLRLTIEQERFEQVLGCLQVRNAFHVKEVQVAIDKLALNKKTVTLEGMNSVLGERIFDTAMTSAEILHNHVNKSLETIPAMQSEIRAIAKRLYPESKFLSYKIEA